MPDLELTPDSLADNGKVAAHSEVPLKIQGPKYSAAFSKKVVEFHGRRALKVWMLVMLSMGERPTPVERAKVMQKRESANDYRRRLRFIRDNLSSDRNVKAPQILYFEKHPGTAASPSNLNKFVDVVSALERLRTKFGPLPQPVDELLNLAVDLPVPPDWSEHDAVALDTSSKAAMSPEKRKVRSSDLTRLHQNSIKLIAGLLTIHYGTLEGNVSTVLRSIVGEANELNITLGLEEHALMTQLELVLASHKD